MVKIEESKNFHPRRKMTSSFKVVAIFGKNIFAKTLYIKVREVIKISDSSMLWLKRYYNLNPAAG